MNEWSSDTWDNLQEQANTLIGLMLDREELQSNRAWQTKLRITLRTLADYAKALES